MEQKNLTRCKRTTCIEQDNISLHQHCLHITLYMHVRHAVKLQLQRKQWWVTSSLTLSVSWGVEWDEVIWIVYHLNKRKHPLRKHTKGHRHVKVVSLCKIECTTCYFTMNHDTSISCVVVCDWSLPEDNYSPYSLAFLQWFPAPWN